MNHICEVLKATERVLSLNGSSSDWCQLQGGGPGSVFKLEYDFGTRTSCTTPFPSVRTELEPPGFSGLLQGY